MTSHTHDDMTPPMTRALFALIGAIAGLSVWALVDLVPDAVANPRVVLVLIASGFGFFSVLLALLGPVRLLPAAAAALGMAVVAALLLLWASFRHDDVEGALDRGYSIGAFIYLLAVGAPLVVAELHRRGGWRHYGMLFDAAWNLVVRVAAAWLFVGIVWLTLFLSNELLGLVGIHVIEDVIDEGAMPYLISGLALGFGLAMVHELRDYVSPFLVIQLLRVLLPALLVVLAIFIAALPFRGLSGLFGNFSAAATLMAVSVAGITLVTTAIHRDDGLSVQGLGMLSATRALSILLPVPAGLALWAVSLRVDQYGLTPDRVAALVAAGIVAVYALAYAVAVLTGVAWRAHQRHVNRWMALLTLAVAALWLTPVLNAERLSTASQVARAAAGAKDPALWEMAHDWGVAGQRGLARLERRAREGGNDALLARIDEARETVTKWELRKRENAADIATLQGVMPLRPEGRSLPDGALDALDPSMRRMIAAACARRAPGGHPGCVLVIADFDPESGAEAAIGFFMTAGSGVQIMAYRLENGILTPRGYPRDATSERYPSATPGLIGDIIEGRFRIVPAPRNVLEVDGMKLFPQN